MEFTKREKFMVHLLYAVGASRNDVKKAKGDVQKIQLITIQAMDKVNGVRKTRFPEINKAEMDEMLEEIKKETFELFKISKHWGYQSIDDVMKKDL